MDRLPVGPRERIYDWLATHPDGKRWDALMAWLQVVSIDPGAVVSKEFVNSDKAGRIIFVSYIPVACTAAVFMVFKTPVRAVHIIRFDDDDYEVFGP